MKRATAAHIEVFRKRCLAERRLRRLDSEAERLGPIPDEDFEEYVRVTTAIAERYEGE